MQPSNREIKRLLEDYLATGGSVKQLHALNDIIATREMSEQERSYYQGEVLPMLETAFHSAIHTRRKAISNTTQVLIIGVWAGILNVISTTPIVPESRKFLTSAITAIALVLQTYIATKAKYHQPEMSQLIARKVFDGLLSESIDRLTGTGQYSYLTEEQRFITMAANIKDLLSRAESQSQEIIKATLIMPYKEDCSEAKIWVDQEKP